ncbi:hypothetical protein DH2020_026449 [Rehmannia glutinosa]|uniref:ubiquitinyl hydrolase 1 n=1 Tax=Rehmannia glutinosa TaxID=99300 RepID=A0ABR0VZA5_REHGL
MASICRQKQIEAYETSTCFTGYCALFTYISLSLPVFVLVHSGGVHGGHYYAFIRPTLSDQWYKFDDERVTKEDVKRALEEQYGGEEELPQTNPGYNNTPFKFTKYSNAYMLVYIRVSDKDKIICDVDEKDIAEHLRVARDEDLREQIGKDIYFDLVDHDKITLYRVELRKDDICHWLKTSLWSCEGRMEDCTTFEHKVSIGLMNEDGCLAIRKTEKENSFPSVLWQRSKMTRKPFYSFILLLNKAHLGTPMRLGISFQSIMWGILLIWGLGLLMLEEVAKEFDIPVQFQRFWIWAKRQNHTYRPNRPLTPQEEAQTLSVVDEGLLKLSSLLCDNKVQDSATFQWAKLKYVGRLFVKSSGKPIEILAKLNEMAGFAPDEEIELFEEIKFEPSVMCEPLDRRSSFRLSQLEDGDIVCFQKRSPPDREEQVRFPEVPSFLEYVKNRQIVHFRALERPKDDEFCLELSKNHTYDDVVEKVAQRLGLDDPSKIRLTPHNCYSQQPKPNPIKYRSVDHLLDMLVHYNQVSDILYYEVLDIPLPELQCLKTLKVAFHHATKDEAIVLNIRLPKQSTVGDVLNEIKTKVELSHPSAELRLLEVFYHKIYKIFPNHEKIENINDQYWTLRAEEIPEEEKNIGPNDKMIHVYHFTKEIAQNQVQVQNFGEPFFLVVHEGETLADVKVRIQKKLQVPDEEFSKWKFAFLSLGRPEYLEDTDIVSGRFQRRDVYGAWEQYLGLEHSDTTPKRAYAANQIGKMESVDMERRIKVKKNKGYGDSFTIIYHFD